MVKTRIFMLDSKQIVELIHDYIAENVGELCLDSSINETSSFALLNKSNVRMLCLFSRNNSLVVNKSELLSKLPYSGFHNFVLTNKEINEVISGNKILQADDLNYAPSDKLKKIKKNSMWLMTLNETDLIWVLYRQLLKFIDFNFESEGKCLQSGLQVDFDGENSCAMFYYGNQNYECSFEKIKDLPYKKMEYWDIKYVDIESSDINNYLKEYLN